MNDNKLFTVKTSMGKEDYHKFLYIATFLRSKMIIPFILLIAALMAAFLAYGDNQFNVTKFIALWILLAMVAILTIIFKVERRNKQRIKTDKTGVFNSQETLDFYEDYLIIKSTVFEGESKIKYSQFYQVLESKDYFITYFNMNQASLIRKKDMDKETIEMLRSLYENTMGKKYKRI
ncbi:YcxB family protein [Sporanaerobacter acetigenes]|uniref:YcxB-like protein n=1 Tax=Sporanaerobacter acetigenes DSM 13106 TaxID=1123281 RepID=A0A1M5Z6X0_9FIRM|nr:YcxB family protein [Sporanaerobacter acetigenes]SHI19970.1 YcxB-like protein [Sporanaerobacter acetigenes DSM 13106]